MTIATRPDTLTTWARSHPRAVMFLAMLAAFATALTITVATRNSATPVYWTPNGYGTNAVLEDTVPVTKAGMATDGTPLWTYADKPQDNSQCVKTSDVILCSYKRSAGGLAGEKVTR